MKKKGVLIITMVVLLVLLVTLAYWQRNTLKVLYMVVFQSEENIQDEKVKQEEKRQDIIDQYNIELPKPADESEQWMEDDGKAEPEQKEETLDSTTPFLEIPPSVEPEPTEQPEVEPEPTPEELAQKTTEQVVKELYEIEDVFRASLQQLIDDSKHEFWSLPKEDQTFDNKIALLKTKLNQLVQLEKDCDSQLEEKLKSIDEAQSVLGNGTSLSTNIRKLYEESKATWKAECLTELTK